MIVDVLKSAQMKRYVGTSHYYPSRNIPSIRCIVPYLGYDLTGRARRRDGLSWKIRGEWEHAPVCAKFSMVSSKAAFLWYATHPDATGEAVAACPRARSSALLGFYPGVYETSGKPSKNIDENKKGRISGNRLCPARAEAETTDTDCVRLSRDRVPGMQQPPRIIRRWDPFG